MKINKMMMLGVLAATLLTGCDEKKQMDPEVAAQMLEGEDKALVPYLGEWDLHVAEVPTMGNVDMTLDLTVEDKKVTGKMKAMAMSITLKGIHVEDEKLNFSLSFQNMDIPFTLERDGETGMKGEMMDAFKVTGEKK